MSRRMCTKQLRLPALCSLRVPALLTIEVTASKKNAGYPPASLPLVILNRNALNRTGGNTPPYNRASGIYWRQRIPSFEPCHKSIMETTIQLHTDLQHISI